MSNKKRIGGVFMFDELTDFRNRIQYICYASNENVASKYKELCEWLYNKYKYDSEQARNQELKYLEKTINKLGCEIQDFMKENKDVDNFIKFDRIEYKNEEEFNEFIEDVKQEYNYLTEKSKQKEGYKYYNRVFSWHKLAPDFLRSSIDNMSKNRINLDGITFEDVDLDEIILENFNIEHDETDIELNLNKYIDFEETLLCDCCYDYIDEVKR